MVYENMEEQGCGDSAGPGGERSRMAQQRCDGPGVHQHVCSTAVLCEETVGLLNKKEEAITAFPLFAKNSYSIMKRRLAQL